MLIGPKQDQAFSEILREYEDGYDANFLFLDSTLLKAAKINSRNGVSFFSSRRWRKDMKPLQISALRNLKLQPQEKGIQVIARQVAELAVTITNGRPYDFVSNVPGGSSGRLWNFAALIAYFVAKELDAPLQQPLIGSSLARCRSSHPKQSELFRPHYREASLAGDFGLLVDDVATSGVHFEKCVDLLRKRGKSVVCVSWIS